MKAKVIVAALIGASSAAWAANADYYLKIEGVSRPSDTGPIFLKVVSSGDLDGDGVPDEGIIRLNCAREKIAGVDFHYNVKSPRDAASGQASGKRTHHPVTFIKEWGPATPQLRAYKAGYNVKNNTKARVASDGWEMISLTDADGLCPVAIDAVKATKSRSNIQNN